LRDTTAREGGVLEIHKFPWVLKEVSGEQREFRPGRGTRVFTGRRALLLVEVNRFSYLRQE
jgi:hypothetical protein